MSASPLGRSRARFEVGALAPIRIRREPETTALYRVIAAHLETFVQRTVGNELRTGLPGFVVRELRAFLRCGILVHGFCRVFCAACGTDALVAFPCKGRGICPSCGARRMAGTAAHLVDRVFPDVAVRQWVLALPHRVRFLCAYDPVLCRRIRRIFVRAIASFYRHRARDRGLTDPRTGCVVFTQRFDSALRLNVHYHALWLDGMFECASRAPRAEADFHPDLSPTDADVARLARAPRAHPALPAQGRQAGRRRWARRPAQRRTTAAGDARRCRRAGQDRAGTDGWRLRTAARTRDGRRW